jgi:N-acetylglucosaminyldiphosphoundecaprenol N-acetyl-beta-D-mannosaminyltransferase
LPETVEAIAGFIQRGGHHRVITVNSEYIIAARYQPAFAAILRSASLAIADGAGVVLAARLLGTPVRGRVTGTDLLVPLAQRAARAGWRVFFLGAAPGVAGAAAQELQRQAPGLVVAGTWSGSPRPVDDAEALRQIGEAHPDILLVAYGAPQQDFWLERCLCHTPATVGMGVGGAFDFLSGRKARAPRVLQRAGLEWLYRLWREPWRARRMLALPAMACLVVKTALARRLG